MSVSLTIILIIKVVFVCVFITECILVLTSVDLFEEKKIYEKKNEKKNEKKKKKKVLTTYIKSHVLVYFKKGIECRWVVQCKP